MTEAQAVFHLLVFLVSSVYAFYRYDGSTINYIKHLFFALTGIYILLALLNAILIGLAIVLAIIFLAFVAS